MLISSAFAADMATQQNPVMQFLPLVVIFVVFYFLIIRPQMARSKDQKKMQEALQKGDEVVTASGQLGKIVKLSEQYVTLDIGGGTETVFQRGAVQTVLPKGTMKEI
ncbi:MAG: preprotein translocase subunit YajC [Parasulfuritortus sp.]|jgi:preprotein translocase subunit YajC|nr:preprotein translocase subunit YajC [Parasulfuritortus sp.]